MDLRRLRAGEWIFGVAGLALAASLFAPWYRAGGDGISAWRAFAAVDVVAAITAAAAIGVAAVVAGQRSQAPGIAAEGLLTILAAVALVVVLVRFLDTPGRLEGLDAARAWGAWLGLAAVFAILVGALAGMRDERLGDPAALPPVKTLPAPPAQG